VAGFALSLESVNGALSQRMQAREYGLAEDYWDTYPEKVIAVGDGSKIAAVRDALPAQGSRFILRRSAR